VALAAVLALAAACGGSGGARDDSATLDPTAGAGGAQRSFLLGLSSLPVDPTEDAYRDAFALAAEAGEVVLIQRAPPWSDFLPNGQISDRTEDLTRLERDVAHKNHLQLFLAIDATVPGDRGELANLPASKAGKDFSDPDIRAAFINYAKYLALNYKPAYLALSVEVDMYFAAKGDGAFRNFLSLYFQAYDEVKSVSKDTLVFPTFQYEDMLGLFNTGGLQRPTWNLVQRFQPKIDMLAVSSFPGIVFGNVHQVPADYYMALKDRIDKPVAIVSTGWSSARGAEGDTGENQQVAFIYRILGAADDLKAHLVVWYLGRDPDAVAEGALDDVAMMGLHMNNGVPKSGWRVWRSAEARPPPQ
jgi:hypothetical protein